MLPLLPPCFAAPISVTGHCRRPIHNRLITVSASTGHSLSKDAADSNISYPLQPTPLTAISFRGRRVLVKRDDTLCIDGLTASKARKFLALTRPEALASTSALVSFGGIQSNAMRSLALFAAHHGLEVRYRVQAWSSPFMTSHQSDQILTRVQYSSPLPILVCLLCSTARSCACVGSKIWQFSRRHRCRHGATR
jgi:hypothetical protein